MQTKSKMKAKIIKQRYQFKKDMYKECLQSKAFILMIINCYNFYRSRILLQGVVYWQRKNYPNVADEMIKTKYYNRQCGRSDMKSMLRYAMPDFKEKYNSVIPESIIMGDAVAVAKRILKKS